MIKDKEELENLVKEKLSFLIDSVNEFIHNPWLKVVCKRIINDKKFQECPAAKKCHQAYKGGLVVHTSEVLDLSLKMAKSNFLEVNYDVLITSAIFHDYGKVWDYKLKSINTNIMGDPYKDNLEEYDDTSHRKLVYHLPRSYCEFYNLIYEYNFKNDYPTDDILEKISHCILSHHGRQEWGSPVEPQITEAYILHFSDMLSSRCSINI